MHAPVSVVMAAYNSAATIVAALDSVARQTVWPREVFVVDDASSDHTLETVKNWQNNQALPVTLLSQPVNAGPASARNAGIARATGDWVAFLDADDAWLPWHLERQYTCIRQNPEVLLLCAQTVDLASTPANGKGLHLPLAPDCTPIGLDTLVSHNPVATSTVLAQTATLRDVNGFDPQFCGPEDYDLWLRIAARGPIRLQQIPSCRYRTTPGSLSMDDRRFLPEVLRVLQKAFAPDGALTGHARLRRRAYAEQYTAASWMAYNRQDRKAALQLLFRSWLCGPTRLAKERIDPLQRPKLLWRYLHKKGLDAHRSAR